MRRALFSGLAIVAAERRARPRAPTPHTMALSCRWNLSRDRPHRAGDGPYPGQARCLALGSWPECFRRLNVKGGRRSFPKETRSALDIEGKHVTIQGPSPDLSLATTLGTFRLRDLAVEPSNP